MFATAVAMADDVDDVKAAVLGHFDAVNSGIFHHDMLKNILKNGESLAYVKDQLGHSSIRMTVDVYGHLVPGANRQAVNKLPSLSDPTGDVEARQEGRLEVAQHKK